jgi:hypothetical protein
MADNEERNVAMKVKVYVIDLEIPARIKKWGLRVGIPAAAMVVGGVAFAGLPGGYADGQPLTAAALTNNFNYLQNEITTTTFGTRTPSAFRAALTSTSTIPFGPNALTVIVFGQVDYDLGAEYSASTGTFTPKNAGIYEIHCNISYNFASNELEDTQVGLLRNGVQVASNGLDIGAGGVLASSPELNTMFQLAAGDSIQCGSYQNTGASQTLHVDTANGTNVFSAARLY